MTRHASRLAAAATWWSVLLLGGCGFTPLYGTGPGSPDADLPAIYVDTIADGHTGQLLRQDLQARLGSPASGADSRYRLSVAPSLAAAAIAVQPDNSSTYTRISGTASWVLATTDVPARTLAQGSARTLDGYNPIDQQYFQATLSNDTTTARIMSNLSDEIVLQLASWFRRAQDRHDPAVAVATDPASAAPADAP